jgi:hypothetical protein
MLNLFNITWLPSIRYNRANHNLKSSAVGAQEMRINSDFFLKYEDRNARSTS